MQQYPEEQFYHDESYHGVTERLPGRRYSCRFKESHRCNKTFTTSGHASRHAKIHTAEKMVRCTFVGCVKKFTRADNMKQHLDTHYKDKPRSSSNIPPFDLRDQVQYNHFVDASQPLRSRIQADLTKFTYEKHTHN
ncbi:hypothetical protein SS1G_06792 [Sclerotinia sclerotiorum 1980 UF-70]|uniref:C2H2 type master regulator of conidiophore development brlA n=1 Tax=Sclerotinia sclerotiorum (strain ATCC 18683 / 1980 / Ss-1) TaxID=665079 RepID=A7EN93_SCLS1|nr:hypothetical protein SS1G_06792 [Sclerotinia sclerotiorum 1980 UF-70]EDO04309.1 hypothetical protein SS1G_06792 [Sclerotinia sclerotiorum 1980 UF-70]